MQALFENSSELSAFVRENSFPGKNARPKIKARTNTRNYFRKYVFENGP